MTLSGDTIGGGTVTMLGSGTSAGTIDVTGATTLNGNVTVSGGQADIAAARTLTLAAATITRLDYQQRHHRYDHGRRRHRQYDDRQWQRDAGAGGIFTLDGTTITGGTLTATAPRTAYKVDGGDGLTLNGVTAFGTSATGVMGNSGASRWRTA